MASLNWRPRHAARGASDRSAQARGRSAGSTDGGRPRPRAAGRLPQARRGRQAPDDDLSGSADVANGVTQDYADPYEPVRPDVRATAGPGWTRPPPWREPDTWTQPTTPWNGPTNWRDTGERWQTGGTKGRGPWRTAQMLFRRRYNTAAVVTIAAVAAVLSLLAAIPVQGRNRGTAAPAVSAAAKQTTFRLVSIEAESPDNTLIGSASAGPYPGASDGQLVRAIGNWGSPRGLGALRFNNIVVPKGGGYVMTFYFVNIRAMATRTAVITASGSQSSPVTVASDSVCCTGQPVVIFLFKGRNSVTFSNSTNEAPAIDRITIKVPVV
ncbi:MAG: hypothetical protein V7603_3280 [Micromonosporaceae bacterium]